MDTKILTCLALLAGASPLTAQVSSPADSASVLLSAAQSFEIEGQPDVAAALYRFIVENFDATPAAVEARLRFSVLDREGAEGSGSVELRIWATTYGAWLGVAIPGWFGADGPEPYGAGLLAGGPAGGLLRWKGAGRFLELDRGSRPGPSRWAAPGAPGRGSAGPRFWSSEARKTVSGVSVTRVIRAVRPYSVPMVIGGLAGIGAGALLSHRPISRGVASTVNYGALWGTWFGVATSILVGFDEGDQPLTGALIGGDAGLLTTALLAPGWNISRNRARLVSIAGVIGGLSGIGLDLLFQPDDEKTAVAIPFATSLIGLAIGAVTSRGSDVGTPSADGALGSLSGALLKLDQGRFGVGFPTPTPTFVRRDLPSRGTALEPAASFTLFAARF